MELWIRELGTKLKGLWKGADRGLRLRLVIGVLLGSPSSGGGVVYTT